MLVISSSPRSVASYVRGPWSGPAPQGECPRSGKADSCAAMAADLARTHRAAVLVFCHAVTIALPRLVLESVWPLSLKKHRPIGLPSRPLRPRRGRTAHHVQQGAFGSQGVPCGGVMGRLVARLRLLACKPKCPLLNMLRGVAAWLGLTSERPNRPPSLLGLLAGFGIRMALALPETFEFRNQQSRGRSFSFATTRRAAREVADIRRRLAYLARMACQKLAERPP